MTTEQTQGSGRIRVEGRFPYDGPVQFFRGFTEVGDPVLLSVLPAGAASRALATAELQPLDRGTLDSGDVYFAYGIPSGETVAQRLERSPMGWLPTARAFLPAVRALAALHEQGEMYQELAPSLMVFVADGSIALVGRELRQLARALDRRKVELPPMDAIPYLSPERTRGEKLSPASDVFAMGAILFEAITGFRAFDARDLFELIHQIQTSEAPELSKYDPKIPVALSDVIGSALRKEPARRPTAEAFASIIAGVLSEHVLVDAEVRTEPDVINVEAVAEALPPGDTAVTEAVKLVAELRGSMIAAPPAEAPPAPASVASVPPLPSMPWLDVEPPTVQKAPARQPAFSEPSPMPRPGPRRNLRSVATLWVKRFRLTGLKGTTAALSRAVARHLATRDRQIVAGAIGVALVCAAIIGMVISKPAASPARPPRSSAPVPGPSVSAPLTGAPAPTKAALDDLRLTLLPTAPSRRPHLAPGPRSRAISKHGTPAPAQTSGGTSASAPEAAPVEARASATSGSDAADELLGFSKPRRAEARAPKPAAKPAPPKRTAADAAFDDAAADEAAPATEPGRRRPIRPPSTQ